MTLQPTRYDLTANEFHAFLDGVPTYRHDQLWHGLYTTFADIETLNTLPKALRTNLAEALPAALTLADKRVGDSGKTTKFLWQLRDGSTIETVLMSYANRHTVCLSSQAGCAMACSFCATGQAGFDRHLSVGEIVEQVIRCQQELSATAPGQRISNIVFMGMGEPFANYDNVLAAVHRFHTDIGLSARHLTLSTVGVIPGIVRLTNETLPLKLAVSLHGARESLRNTLVPLGKRYPLDMLSDTLATYWETKRRRISFEWAMINEINDTAQDADELAAFVKPLAGHVNLIPLNATPGYPTQPSPPATIRRFVQRLEHHGVNVTVRNTRGDDIEAACGQLRLHHTTTVQVPTPVHLPN